MLGKPTIPAIFVSQLDELSRKELEYEENIQRKNLNWIEECKAVSEIHRIKKLQYTNNFPERFGKGWSQKNTADAINMSEGKVSQDCAIAEALAIHPEVSKAANRKEALRVIRHLQENCVPDESLYQKKLRDCFTFGSYDECCKRLLPRSVDCFITDVTGQNSRKIISCMADKLAYSGHGFLFFPIEEMVNISKLLSEFQLPFRAKPFIYHVKGEDMYQTFFWWSRALAEPCKKIPDLLSYNKDKTNMHTLSKPYQLYYTLIINSTNKNGLVVDPNCYDTTLAHVCIDHARNVDTWCGNSILHEQGILNAK
jgi:hypothetical protein